MDVMTQLNCAMDYIEENILDKSALEEVAGVTSYSQYHFARLFYYVADMPLSEYVRKRKLSLAAEELRFGKAKVIEIALKYGYDSPDSFSRAFFRQHGMTPTAARNTETPLNYFPKLKFQIQIKGEVQ